MTTATASHALSTPSAPERRASRWAVCTCILAISILSIVPSATPRESAAPGVIGVNVHLERARVADDEEGVAELIELAFECDGVEVFALDEERRAVAEAREFLVDGVDADLVLVRGRLGQRLARHDRGDAAEDLRQAGASRVDDAGLAQHLQLLRRALDRLLGRLDQLAHQVRNGRIVRSEPLRCLGGLADDREHRPLDGLPNGAVGGVARPAQRPAIAAASIGAASPSDSAAPRTICERMTPELPRADISAARVTACANSGRPAVSAASSASTIPRAVSVRFVPVSPSGTG